MPACKRQIGSYLPVILDERSKDVVAIVLPRSARISSLCVETARFGARRVIQEVPDVVKVVVRPANRIVQVVEIREFGTKLDRLLLPVTLVATSL